MRESIRDWIYLFRKHPAETIHAIIAVFAVMLFLKIYYTDYG